MRDVPHGTAMVRTLLGVAAVAIVVTLSARPVAADDGTKVIPGEATTSSDGKFMCDCTAVNVDSCFCTVPKEA